MCVPGEQRQHREVQKGLGEDEECDSGYEKKAGKAAKWKGSRLLLGTTEGSNADPEERHGILSTTDGFYAHCGFGREWR